MMTAVEYDSTLVIPNSRPKVFVSRDDRVLKRYEPTDQMTDIEADICLEVYIK